MPLHFISLFEVVSVSITIRWSIHHFKTSAIWIFTSIADVLTVASSSTKSLFWIYFVSFTLCISYVEDLKVLFAVCRIARRSRYPPCLLNLLMNYVSQRLFWPVFFNHRLISKKTGNRGNRRCFHGHPLKYEILCWECFQDKRDRQKSHVSSLNIFGDDDVLILSLYWTLSIICV
jgi:hypothetical protein